MKNHHIFGAVVLLVVLVVLYALFSTAVGTEQREDQHERVELTGVHDRHQFWKGSRVRVHDATLTDAFVAGRHVSVERVQAQDIHAAGWSLLYRDSVFDDLLSAGATVTIESEVRDDLIAAGGQIRLAPGGSIGGDVIVAAGDLDLNGDIRGNVVAAGNHVVLSGRIGGDVEVLAGELIVDPGASIGGKLTYRSDKPAYVAEGAVIDGGVERVASQGSKFPTWAGIAIGIAAILAAILSAVALGIALQAALPNRLHGALAALVLAPWSSWLAGFALLVATPVAANLLLATVVGMPIGLFMYALYVIALALGVTTAAYWLGSLFARRKSAGGDPPAASTRVRRTALGMFSLVLLGLIPIIGWLLLVAAVPLGTGAFIMANWRSLQRARPAPAAPMSQPAME